MSDERHDTLIKTCDQLRLFVIDEISLVGKMFLKKYVLLILNDQLIQMKLMGLIMNYFLKKNLLVELCIRNYVTSYGFVNGVNGIFQYCTKTIFKLLIWIHF